jgi:hypothetical protein
MQRVKFRGQQVPKSPLDGPIRALRVFTSYRVKGLGATRVVSMTKAADNLNHSKKGTAILATCIVQTLNESDLTFQRRFLERLANAYIQLKDNTEGDVIQELELLTWTRSLLTGWDPIAGQGKPYLQD